MFVESYLAGKRFSGASGKNSSYPIIQLVVQRLAGHSSEADGDSFSQSWDQHCVHFDFSEVSIKKKVLFCYMVYLFIKNAHPFKGV